jgi:hypothetical protein
MSARSRGIRRPCWLIRRTGDIGDRSWGAASIVPTADERRGIGAAAEFFRILHETKKITSGISVQPKEFIAQTKRSYALPAHTPHPHGRGPPSSDRLRAIVFTFREGKVIEFTEYKKTDPRRSTHHFRARPAPSERHEHQTAASHGGPRPSKLPCVNGADVESAPLEPFARRRK